MTVIYLDAIAATKKLVDFIIFFKKVEGDYYCFYYFKQGYTNTALFWQFFKKKFHRKWCDILKNIF